MNIFEPKITLHLFIRQSDCVKDVYVNALRLIIENACEIGLEEEKSGVIAVVRKNYLSF